MFEFVISAGEGTLIEHGVLFTPDGIEDIACNLNVDEMLSIEACAQDCETGL